MITDKIEQFFQALYTEGMKSVYSDKVPAEMMKSPPDESGWYEWKLIPGVLTDESYRELEQRFNITLPQSFIEWHRRYFFAEGDCSIVRLPESYPSKPLQEIINSLDWHVPKLLISQGLIPFADEGNDTGPLVFDVRNAKDKSDFPIRLYDHEFGGEIDGLGDIIFSSFDKLLECLTHYLEATKTKQSFEVIPDFYKIDPSGAGSTGKSYWAGWVKMQKSNYEEFGY